MGACIAGASFPLVFFGQHRKGLHCIKNPHYTCTKEVLIWESRANGNVLSRCLKVIDRAYVD